MEHDDAAIVRIGARNEVIYDCGYPRVGDVSLLGLDDRVNVRLDIEPPSCAVERQVPEYLLGFGECLLQDRRVLARAGASRAASHCGTPRLSPSAPVNE